MSSFKCKHCGTHIIDTDSGYVTECEHFPLEKVGKCKHCETDVYKTNQGILLMRYSYDCIHEPIVETNNEPK